MFIVAHNGARVWGGAERAVALLLAGLQQRGHRVLLLCNDAVVAGPARALGVDAQILPLGGDASVHHAARLARRLRELRPDALLVGMFKKAWLAGLAGRMAHVPRIVVRIGLETDVPRNAKYRFAFRRLVDQVVVVAERLRPAYAALPGYAAGRLSVIPNAVHPPAPRSDGALRTELGIPSAARCVGSVARLVAQKRLDRLLDAVARLPGEVHCVVAGDGPLRGALQRQAAALGIAGRVHFLGHRPNVAEVLAALDVFVMTSDREGMSNAMLEALAAEVPVVSTRVSGTDEALRPGGSGIAPGIVVGFDADAVADGIRGVLDDDARRHAMRAAAGVRARGEFGFPRVLDAWERVLAGGSADLQGEQTGATEVVGA
ncbi:glycosyltransferase [Longimicrobium sp.]|uniref:glycosyltransferase n=1 Tax=Longimicrobium sp. TaxID=2029185 RepID=UPI003B3AAE44